MTSRQQPIDFNIATEYPNTLIRLVAHAIA